MSDPRNQRIAPDNVAGMALITFDGRLPAIAETAWLAPTALLIGSVEVADGASIFFGAVLRGDGGSISVGRDTNLQENVVVHADHGRPVTLGDRISVGHAAVLHGCTIGDDVLIGMSATVLNGAVIGAGSLIAAGTVVREGMHVPPGSLVAGVPGEVRRELSERERADITSNAEHYRALSRRYAHQLEPVGTGVR